MATVGAAESCTGGLLSSIITAVPGSSAYFLGSVVSYSNEIKSKVLNVPEASIRAHGAVSQEVAQKMAEGVRHLLNCTYAVSITGIAGPGGGSSEKPVGTIWFGVCGPHFVYTYKQNFNGDREQIRLRSAQHALQLLIQHIKE